MFVLTYNCVFLGNLLHYSLVNTACHTLSSVCSTFSCLDSVYQQRHFTTSNVDAPVCIAQFVPGDLIHCNVNKRHNSDHGTSTLVM